MNLKTIILDCLFPIECLGCRRDNIWLCPTCFKKLKFKTTQICLACQSATPHGEFCSKCRDFYNLEGIFTAGDYDDPLLADLIKKFKFYGLKDLALVLSEFLLAALANQNSPWPEFLKIILPRLATTGRNNFWFDFFKSEPLIIPLPLSRKRLNWRGYNQAELLAQAVAAKLNKIEMATNLIKTKDTATQSSLKEAERLINLNNCFAWTGVNLKKQNIILIDDVSTTGTSLNEAARVLRAVGAGKIWGLVLAKG
ncbi:MAG: ComF family protein [Candidatus Falkowbacteria bacterium]|nr:ComF family protein [Candidatus Falkowbacteria bacterium]